jgi:hypothetical protein
VFPARVRGVVKILERLGRASHRKPVIKAATAAEVLERELRKPPEAFDLHDLVPVLVPRTFSETGHWPGPIHRLAAGDFDQTWAVLCPNDAPVYVSRPHATLWEAREEAWQARAEGNLRRLAEAEPFSHVYTRSDGSAYMVVMLYGQNLAGSRLLVRGLLDATFPEGYLVAVPEMTCALAFSTKLDQHEAEAVDDMITTLFAKGEEPVSLSRYPPEQLWELASDDLGLAE